LHFNHAENHCKQSSVDSTAAAMSFDQLSSLEAGRRRGTPGYADDPDFQRLSQDLMNKLFKLNGNNQRLSGEVGHLGTRRDTPRVRERVHELIEESRDTFKDVGEGVKKMQTWEDVTVSTPLWPSPSLLLLTPV
jgi:syntaxin 7